MKSIRSDDIKFKDFIKDDIYKTKKNGEQLKDYITTKIENLDSLIKYEAGKLKISTEKTVLTAIDQKKKYLKEIYKFIEKTSKFFNHIFNKELSEQVL